MKKIITLIVAMALIFSVAVIPASAATWANDFSVTMNKDAAVSKEDCFVVEEFKTESQRYKYTVAAARIEWNNGDESDSVIFEKDDVITYAGVTCELVVASDNGVDIVYNVIVYGTPEKAGTYKIDVTLNFHMNENATGFEMGTTQSRRTVTVTVPGGEGGGDNEVGDNDGTSSMPSLDGNGGGNGGNGGNGGFNTDLIIYIGIGAAVVVAIVVIIIVVSKKKSK